MSEKEPLNSKSESREKDQSQYRRVSSEELAAILVQHEVWLNSDGKQGKRASLENAYLPEVNLSKANLKKADLRGAFLFKANLLGAELENANLESAELFFANLNLSNLTMANLRNANLLQATMEKAMLHGADLREARLREAKLNGARLLKAKLRDADLRDADLREALALSGEQLGGTNSSGTKLPSPINEFEGLTIVDEASKNARKLFVSMLLGCFYSWLTIATTTDVRLLTNSASSPLPIIGTAIPIVGFYIAAPILLLGLYVYFHLYLQRLWEALADLPAVFPDGRPLDKRVYPWLLNGLVRSHFYRLREDRLPFSRMQTAISILLGWWIVPFTLLLFYGRYLRRLDWTWTRLHIGLLALLISLAIIFQRLARRTLRGAERRPFLWKKVFKDVRTYKRAGLSIAAVIIGAFFYLLSLGLIEGVPIWKDQGVRCLVPTAFEVLGYNPWVNIVEADVSMKPDNWTGDSSQIALVEGARLKGANLRYADAWAAFLVRADLREANLQGAEMSGADLREANLQLANLSGADLDFANLSRAILSSTFMIKLRTASRWTPQPSYSTHLENASLRYANLQDAKLKGAFLQGADLTYANLSRANLEGTILEKANLSGADLRGAKYLTKEQLESAIIDSTTQLPDYLK
jgi:uncharacterized protein YjbI with pentapeptide repeats